MVKPIFLSFAFAFGACDDRRPPEPASRNSATASLEKSAKSPAPDPAPYSPAESSRPGFSPVRLIDEVPICVFSSYEAWQKAKFANDVEPQRLTADSRVVIGAFAPWCVNEACDDRPFLQCLTEQEGATVIVSTRYSGDHRDGSKCTEDCRPITAASASIPLEAGSYTLRYGERTLEFEIPGVLRSPCLDAAKGTRVKNQRN